MKRNPYYALEMVNGTPYLLPFGQNVADNRLSFMMNETGVFIWNHLEDAETDEAMVDLLLKNDKIDPENLDEVKMDLQEFMDMLRQRNVILPDKIPDQPVIYTLSIAGIRIELRGMSYIPKSFESFQIFGDQKPDLTVTVIAGIGGLQCGETVVFHSKELNVFESETNWHLDFPTFENIESAVINKELTKAEIKIRYDEEKSAIREQFFHVMRHLFLMKAQSFGLFAIHSASLLYRGKAYLFSGPSGTGKSTHTKLWKDLFNIEYLNGDLNLLSDEGVVYGIPWCGTSEIFTAKQYELGGIIFLKQAKENRVEILEGDQKSLRIAQRLISPVYNREQLEENLSFAVNLAKRIPAWRLHCTKDPSAAELMKETIDHYRNRSME